MREIEFRGIKTDGNGFIYGLPTYDFEYLFNENGLDSPDNYTIKKSTVGQFTGLLDKNGVKIFEGDIMKDKYGAISQVIYVNEQARFMQLSKIGYTPIYQFSILEDKDEVIGNIHQNPELLNK